MLLILCLLSFSSPASFSLYLVDAVTAAAAAAAAVAAATEAGRISMNEGLPDSQ
jgi:hypothetical protein